MNGVLSGNRIADVLVYLKKTLSAAGYEERALTQLSKLLLEDLLNVAYVQIHLHPNRTLSESEILQLHRKVKRLVAQEPIQYVLGYTWFLNRKYWVSPAVLIPRPETEELVVHVHQRMQGKNNGRLIDLGTGSGCIAIALKDKMPSWEVMAIDVSQDALNVAIGNAQLNEQPIVFAQQDILDMSDFQFAMDVIVSNPPYVLRGDQIDMEEQVLKFEPHLALFVEDHDPLQYYKAITNWAGQHLLSDGLLAFEVHENYAWEVAQLLIHSGFRTEVLTDMQDKNRFVFGTR